MLKNLKKNIAEGGALISKNERLDLTVGNIIEITEKHKNVNRCDDLLELIADVYKVGLAVGTRNGLRKGAAHESN